LGPTESNSISTIQFLELKKWQVYQDMEINTMFNKPMSMFYVDLNGNLLSNMKLSFYEHSDDKGFFSKMFTSDQDQPTRQCLVKSYSIIQEIYDDILYQVRLKHNVVSEKWFKGTLQHFKQINQIIIKDK
jgi:hypothetical protein